MMICKEMTVKPTSDESRVNQKGEKIVVVTRNSELTSHSSKAC